MNNEILHLEAEEISIDTQINDALVKRNITDSLIASLQEKYGGLQLESLNDRDGYELVKAARKECKSWRVMADKICKSGREEANKVAQSWINKGKEVCGKIGAIEDALEEQEKAFEVERERIKKEKIDRENRQWLSRSMELAQFGATISDDSMVLESISFENSLIRECDDEIYQTIIKPGYKEIFDRINANKIAKEAEEKRQREEFAAQQAELKRQQWELETKKQEAKVAEQQRIAAEEREKYNERVQILNDIGLVWSHKKGAFVYFDYYITNESVIGLSDEDFYTYVFDIKPLIVQTKVAIEENHRLKLEEENQRVAQEAIRKERERVEKERQEEKRKSELAEMQKQKELAEATDKVKWAAIVEHLQKTPIHPMVSAQYKSKMKAVRDLLAGLKIEL